MSELSQLTPQPLWTIFAEICSIPHPSYHEEALAQHIMQWATARHLQVERDAVGNILIRKAATSGMEKCTPVVLQAHLDMVPQKNSETDHDFAQDPLQVYIDGCWVKANGTTLGADNGIGMASCLAVLSSEKVEHGPLEVLLTMTEEAGMEGAFGLQPNWLRGEILINTDAEEEGAIYMGCAGGLDVTTTLPLHREPTPANSIIVKLTLKGLKGGHSGCDIHLGLGNANKLIARFLSAHAAELELRLLDLQGGTLRNAIPREASATIALPAANLAALNERLTDFDTLLHSELAAVEKNVLLQLEKIPCSDHVLSLESQQKLLALINANPNGVIRMSDEVSGVVETSLNLGIVKTEDKNAILINKVRSQIDSSKQYVTAVLKDLGYLAGAHVEASGSYPGWKPNPHSPMMHLARETYQQLYAATPNIMVIHAGLECGLFKKPYPNMDMISIGPTIVSPHSPDERVEIASVGKYWQFLVALLRATPKKA